MECLFRLRGINVCRSAIVVSILDLMECLFRLNKIGEKKSKEIVSILDLMECLFRQRLHDAIPEGNGFQSLI